MLEELLEVNQSSDNGVPERGVAQSLFFWVLNSISH